MSLPEITNADTFPIFENFRDVRTTPDDIGVYPAIRANQSAATRFVHLISTDKLVGLCLQEEGNTGSPGDAWYMRADPNFFDTSASGYLFAPHATGLVANVFFVDTFDPATGTQRLFAKGQFNLAVMQEFDPVTMIRITEDAFSGFGGNTNGLPASSAGSFADTEGWVMFGGLTGGGFDGVPVGS